MIDTSLFSLPGIRKVLGLLAGLAVGASLAIIGLAWGLSSAITNLWLGETLPDQFLWIALFLLCFIGLQAIAYLQDSILDGYAHKQANLLRQELVTAIFTRGSELVQAHGTGNTTTLLLEGIEQVELYLRLVLPKMMRILIIPLLLLIPVFILDWVSGVVMVIVFPFIILYMILLGRTAQEKAAQQHKKFQVLSNHFIDSLRGIDTLKFFGSSKQHGKNIYEVSEQFRKATMKTLRVATLSSSVLDLFATLSLAAVAILLGLRLLDGSLALFPALTILVLAPEYFKPIREFASDFHASLDGRNSLASIQRVIGSSQNSISSESTTEVAEGTMDSIRASDKNKAVIPVWSESTTLTADSVFFSYNGFEALQDISFGTTGFSKVGVVGMSGAGKSTFIQLLSGFASPDKGLFCINNTCVTSLRRPDWHKHIAYLPQDPYIFHATLRENISFYHPNATEDEVARAVAVVGLQSMIDELPQGLDTQIGEGERALSGGQAQRVALARVCLDAGRSILFFDEPTAHLDIETEFELKQRMLPLMHNRLVFFATHRLHWMHDMDLILVLDKGRLVESGTLEELLSRKSYFYSLASRMEGSVA